MTTLRKKKFQEAVSKAARKNSLPMPSGRPVPENLTQQGRVKGLKAMMGAKRCNARRRDGNPCQAPAMRGAQRCMKHGGRVEVPAHPHNIKRFLSGEMYRAEQRHLSYLRDRKKYEAIPYSTRREILSVLPETVIHSTQIYRATVLYHELEQAPFKERQRIWNDYLTEIGVHE
jgi:hypothetical protein